MNTIISPKAKPKTHIIKRVKDLPKDLDLYKITGCIKSYDPEGKLQAQFIMQHEFSGRKIRVGKYILAKYNKEY